MKALLDLGERTLWTYIEALLGFWVLLGDEFDAGDVPIVLVAALPAALTVISVGLPGVPESIHFGWQVVLRAIRTFVVTFIGVVLASAVPDEMFRFTVETAQAAWAAALVAAIAVIKGGVASLIGNRDSAALLPAQYDSGTA